MRSIKCLAAILGLALGRGMFFAPTAEAYPGECTKPINNQAQYKAYCKAQSYTFRCTDACDRRAA